MLGGAIGSALRFLIATSIDRWTGVVFPWGTILVNIVGCFFIGLVAGLTSPDSPLMLSPVIRTFIMIGILGGFTTFSSSACKPSRSCRMANGSGPGAMS